MNKFNLATIGLAVCALGLATTSAQAIPWAGAASSSFMPNSTAMTEGPSTMAPLGHIVLCMKHPKECRPRKAGKGYKLVKASSGGPAVLPAAASTFETRIQDSRTEPDFEPVVLTPQAWKQLVKVNNRINTKIVSVTDRARTGRLDVWSVSGNRGDCEDYAIQKRAALIHLGWPSHSALITLVMDPLYGPHAVLVVRTNKGDFVLDNLRKSVVPWQETPYQWIKRQSIANPRKWVRLTDAPTRIASYQPAMQRPPIQLNTSRRYRAAPARRTSKPRVTRANSPRRLIERRRAAAKRQRVAKLGISAKRHSLDRDMATVWSRRVERSRSYRPRNSRKIKRSTRRSRSGGPWFSR